MAFQFPPPPPPPPNLSAPTNDFRGGRGGRGGPSGRARGRFRGGSSGQNSRGGKQYPFPSHSDSGQRHGLQNQIRQAPAQALNPNSSIDGSRNNAMRPFQGQYGTQTHHNLAPVPSSLPFVQQNHDAISSSYQPMYHGSFGSHRESSQQFSSQTSSSQQNMGLFHSTFNVKTKHSDRISNPALNTVRPEVAPPVPSFGISLPSKASQASTSHSESNKRKDMKRRKFNQLGLTPRKEEHEDSEEEIDDEAKHAHLGPELKFEYKGRTSNLTSPAALAAWIAERKKRWPTKARIEEKQREARERQESRAASAKKFHATRISREMIADPATTKPSNSADSNQGKVQLKLMSETASTCSNSSDAGPDEQPSKQNPNVPQPRAQIDSRPTDVCYSFLNKGQCKRGRNCAYRHVRPQAMRIPEGIKKAPRRVTLSQRFWEQEVDEIDAIAAQAVDFLSTINFFEAPVRVKEGWREREGQTSDLILRGDRRNE